MRNKLLMASALLSISFMASAESTEERIKQQISKIDQRIPVVSVTPAKMAGLYEVELGTGETIFADANGEYFLLGQLYQLTDEQGFVNLSEQKANGQRQAEMAKVPEKDLVTFKAEGVEKASVFVFTDVDCPYCRKLHEEVPKLQSMGISVSYLAFPRQGPGSPAHKKMSDIWCSTNRTEAMTQSKQGKDLDVEACDNPVLKQYAVGQKVGVTGTPAIITSEGQLLPGYMPAERLAAVLGIKP